MIQKYWVHELLDQIKTPISNLLDVGCGEGYFTSSIKANKALGIDINDLCIKSAKLNYETDSVKFICGDITKLKLGTKFDVVLCFSVLHWIPDAQVALENIYDCCDVGGFVYVIMAAKVDGNIFDECVTKELIKHDMIFSNILMELDLNSFTNLSQTAGFK